MAEKWYTIATFYEVGTRTLFLAPSYDRIYDYILWFLMLEIRNYGHVDRKILISWEWTSKMKLLAAEANKSNQIVWWSLIMRRSRDTIWGHVTVTWYHMITFAVNFTRQQFSWKCKQYCIVTTRCKKVVSVWRSFLWTLIGRNLRCAIFKTQSCCIEKC